MARPILLGTAATLGLVLGLGGFTGACSDSTAEKLQTAKLAQSCLINSDCAAPLVCAFQRCHTECETSRDCSDAARCVAAERPFHICLLEDESSCTRGAPCPAPLVCAADLECRDGCRTNADCVPGQECVSATCVEPTELDDKGHLEPVASAESPPVPCNYNSDCPTPRVCQGGECVTECTTDTDCGEGLVCTEARCVPGPSAECHYHSDCPKGQVCEQGSCTKAPAPAECAYASDCAVAGQLCESGVCRCACAANEDCASGLSCDGCGCVPATVVKGDYYVRNTWDIERLQNVTEIAGTLVIVITTPSGITDLRIPSVKKVERVALQSLTGLSLTFSALEEVTKDVYIQLTDLTGDGLRFPKLRKVGGTFQALSNPRLTALTLPVLESVGGGFGINSNFLLQEIDAPSLKSVGAAVQCSSNQDLTRVSFPALETVALTLNLTDNPKLTQAELPSLRTASTLSFVQNPITVLNLPALEQVAGSFTVQESGLTTLSAPILTDVGELALRMNAKLTAVQTPHLTTVQQTLAIENCTALSNLDSLNKDIAGSLANAGSEVSITDNGSLSSCAVDALFASLASQGWTGSTSSSGNLECVCNGAVCQ